LATDVLFVRAPTLLCPAFSFHLLPLPALFFPCGGFLVTSQWCFLSFCRHEIFHRADVNPVCPLVRSAPPQQNSEVSPLCTSPTCCRLLMHLPSRPLTTPPGCPCPRGRAKPYVFFALFLMGLPFLAFGQPFFLLPFPPLQRLLLPSFWLFLAICIKGLPAFLARFFFLSSFLPSDRPNLVRALGSVLCRGLAWSTFVFASSSYSVGFFYCRRGLWLRIWSFFLFFFSAFFPFLKLLFHLSVFFGSVLAFWYAPPYWCLI